MEKAVVLYPTPPIGHLRAMVELGKAILSHQPSLSVHVLIATPPYQADATAPYIAAVSNSVRSITFHRLPEITLPPSSNADNHEELTFEVLRLSNPYVHDALVSISKTYKIQALVMDFFISVAFKVAKELKILPYYLNTCSAGFLASFLYIPTLHKQTTKSFKDMDGFVHVPGVPPIPPKDMIKPLLDRTKKAYECFYECSIAMSKSAGIITNTFEALEPRVITAIGNGLCVPDGPTPPIHCIGPLIASVDEKKTGDASGGRVAEYCLTWLDSQPSKSVVFLCFGSLGLFSKQQLGEIAMGLERSGQRFLWVVRNPPSGNLGVAIKEQGEPDLNALLPEGFLERTKDRGLVVKSWAPQVAVLNHDSVGGFVTHCGWNSVLEAVTAGVPMVAWPLYAEQRLNRVLLVEEMKIALPMVESEKGFVNSDEVEKRVRDLMESKDGKLIREQITAMKEAAKAAWSERGSSRLTLAKLVGSWMHE
ncbi:UDP-glucuronosyl/UDP-glucosyltransferase [Corchorus capsularis]|uniref:Glycosyltransferase n=1 Tax=Corchorus capsularis TaxID=210143 RepID=A0A1R3KFA9_COCAP|nr:UDP-glucuronosyl/UDP-glucosyltransferase [Corchorus capsularis]